MEEVEAERLELRLLTEPSFVEEFDTVVDEVTDQYARDELTSGERKAFEAKFLATAEGKQKLRFTSELLERAAAERPAPIATPVQEKAGGLFDSIRAFWQSPSMRLAASAAAVVIIAVGILLIYIPTRPGPKNFAPVSLSISTASRGQGNAPAKVKLESGMAGVQATLAIPEQARGANDYQVKLVGDTESKLDIEKRTEQSVTVNIPASLLKRGQYALQMSSVNPDKTVHRISGSYYFDVE